MAYPSKKKLAAMDQKLKDARGTLMVGPSSSAADKFRWNLCQNLMQYMGTKGLSQIEFANLLGIDQARISEIVHHRIDKVSTDKLITYNQTVDPNVEFKIVR